MRKQVYFCASAAVLLAMGGLTEAKADGTMLTEVPGVRALAAPPANFDPVHASALQRGAYGIPPAPDAAKAPAAYAAWLRAQTLGKIHEPATLQPTKLWNTPNHPLHFVRTRWLPLSLHGVASPTVSNVWSGTSAVDSTNPFKLEEVQVGINVPTAQPAPGTCVSSNPTSYASQWAGIDGNGSPDVLQAGILLAGRCNGSSTGVTTSYSAWIEWYPNSLVQVSSPAVSPGDYVQVSVWNTSPTTAYANFVNTTTKVSATYQLTAPAGTSLVGNSVEWIIEPPTLATGTPSFLVNYNAESWPVGVAWNYTSANPTYYYSGQATSTATGQFQVIDMLNAANQVISNVTPNGQQSLLFQAY